MNNSTDFLTPREIVAELDTYIVGQQSAKKNVAIALRNRWRRMRIADIRKEDVAPSNILMMGPTGVGKTEIARRIAKIAKIPFVKVEASKFTEVGYVGRDVESMVRDLVERAVAMVKAEKSASLQEKASQAVEEIILDALIPTSNAIKSTGHIDLHASEQAFTTRERFREKLRKGELENQQIEIKISKPHAAYTHNMSTGQHMEEGMMMNLQDMLGSFLPKQSKKKKVTIGEARSILLTEEVHKLLDMQAVREEAVALASNAGIIFIDEIDKIATSQPGNGPGVSREGVQRDLLPIVEGCAVQTKYGTVHTDHILFIGAGAFHMAKPSDLIPELQGRFPIRVTLESLSKKDFFKILDEPKSALPIQYEALLEVEGVTLVFEQDAKEEIASIAYFLNEDIENIGARRLQTVMTHLLAPFLFDVPDRILPGSTITITKDLVKRSLTDLSERKNISQFIL